MKWSKSQKTEVNISEKPDRYNLNTFVNSIKGWALTQEQQEEAIQWLRFISFDIYMDFRDLLENFYILYFDYIIFGNQNTLMIYKLKELQDEIYEMRKSGPQPYRKLKKESKEIIWNSYLKLAMKYDNFDDQFKDKDHKIIKEEIINNEEYSLDTISDRKKFMDIIRKYSKEERYLW